MQMQTQTTGWQKPKKKQGFGSKLLTSLGRIGKALMFPIAVLPIAAILNRLGAQLPGDTDFAKFIQSLFKVGGSVVFDNLHILFGIGVAFGLTKDNRGEAALVGFVGIMALGMLLGSANGGVDLTNQIYGGVKFELPDPSILKSGLYGTPDLLFNQIDNVWVADHWAWNVLNGTDSSRTIADAKNYIIDVFNGVKNPGGTTDINNFAGLEGFWRVFADSKYNAILQSNVLNGIMAGGFVAFIYNRWNGIELPKVIGFFSGRRLVPVLGLLGILAFGILWVIIFPWIGYILYLFSTVLGQATGDQYGKAAVSGVYVFLNRMLIPFGLHHVPNTLFWFVLSEHPATGSGFVYGDINIFLNGIPKGNTSGAFQTGFFPAMMFILPVMTYCFYKTAETKVQKQRVLSMFAPLAMISFLTGITEPIEFAFMYVSPLLYVVYSAISAVWGFIINLFGIQIGFGFSAGFIDYLLSFPKSLQIIDANKTGAAAIFANPLWLFPVGIIAGISTYFPVKWMIKKMNLSTPGRGSNLLQDEGTQIMVNSGGNAGGLSLKGQMIIAGLGGWNNISNYQSCSTRLRYDINDMSLVNETMIKKSGAMGFQKIGQQAQVIIGPAVEILNNEIQASIGSELHVTEQSSATKPVTPVTKTEAFKPFVVYAPMSGKVVSLAKLADQSFSQMGKGVAITPSSSQITSWANQELELGFRTGHAFVVKQHGISIIIHVGLDTNKILSNERLANQVYKSNFKDTKNVTVKKNDVLVTVDLATAKNNAVNLTTPIVCLSETLGTHSVKMLVKHDQLVKKGEPLFEVH